MTIHTEAQHDDETGEPYLFIQDQWHEIDTSDLTGKDAKSVAAYDDAMDTVRIAREIMEDNLRAMVAEHIPSNLEARFAYRWGKKSVAAVEPRTKSAKSGNKIKL